MASRRFNQPPPMTPIQAPTAHSEWTTLMQKTIAMAEKMEDRRLPGLRRALSDGKAEGHLRMLGIISEADLRREFPAKA